MNYSGKKKRKVISAGIYLTALLVFFCPAGELYGQMRTVKVAMCQIFSIAGDRSGNFVRVENAIRQAKEAGAEVVCFPETVVLGWVNPDAHERACPIPGEDSRRFCELAEKYKVYICTSLAEKDGTKLYDSALLIDDKGQILLKHRKLNIMPGLMEPPYTPGQDVNTVETGFGRIGVLICADTFKEEVLVRMAEQRPDILLVPYGWAAPEAEWPAKGRKLAEVVAKAAKATSATVIGTDAVGQITKGPWKGYIFGGQSIAVDRDGNVLALAKDRDRDIKTLTLTVQGKI